MGTAASYDGSGGAWNGAGDDLNDWLDSLPDGPSSGDNPADPTNSPSPALTSVMRGVARGLRGSGGGGGGGGASGGSSGAGGGGSSGGSNGRGRSGRSAGSVGGRAAAGVAAYRAGNAAELRALGIDPAELDGLPSDYARAARIAEAASDGAPTSIQDEELRRAAAATAIWGLEQQTPPSAEALVRQFVEEYLYRVVTVEFGARLRDSSADGAASLPAEQTLRSTIRGMTQNLPPAESGAGQVDLGKAIESTYDKILEIWSGDA